MIDGSTQTRQEAVSLVSDARIQAADGERSFAFLMGLRDTLYAWLAEVELELKAKVATEAFGYFSEGVVGGETGQGEAYEEMVIGDPTAPAELADFFESVPFSDSTDTFESEVASDMPEPEVASDTFEPAVASDMSESVVVSDTHEQSVASDTLEQSEPVGGSSPLPVDTRQVLPSEWPSGMVPTESGVGWRRGEEVDVLVRRQAVARSLEMLFKGRTLREVGRIVVGMRRGGT